MSIASVATLTGLVLSVFFLLEVSEARPSSTVLSRPKRLADQKMMDIETRIELSKMREKSEIGASGFDKDISRIERIRRSSAESNLQELRRILKYLDGKDAKQHPKARNRAIRLLNSLQQWAEREDKEDNFIDDRDEYEGLVYY